jgi:hypothetical protein
MSVKHIWGFGGVRLICGSTTCDLPYATGTLAFEPRIVSNETLAGEMITQFVGYRVRIGVTAQNSCATDYTEFLKLISILNDNIRDEVPLLVYPLFTSGDNNLVYQVRVTSGIEFAQIARVKAGQTIELAFESVSLINTLPSLTSDPDVYFWTYSEDAGSTEDNLIGSEDAGSTTFNYTFGA